MRFPWQKRKHFFSDEEQQHIVDAIRNAERMTSGEVRVYVEGKCPYMDALDRASQLFFKMKMNETNDRNGVLVYVAVKDRQLAIFGDEAIHNKVGSEYWLAELKKMIEQIKDKSIAAGISEIVTDIGEVLNKYFPYNNDTDKNELPDEIVFGK